MRMEIRDLEQRACGAPFAIPLLAALFCFRLGVGLCSEFWSADERQIYLIGLKSFTTDTWPYFGPDLVLKGVDEVHQIPGALQGLLVALPFRVAAVPEAPFVLLNALSFAALLFLAWYGSRRAPTLPRWLVYGLALTLPWTLFYSTHVVNPSYVLAGSVVFFVGLTEALVYPDDPILRPRVADAFLGFGLLWIAQLHLSWALLVPFAAAALAARARRGELAALAAFAAGAAVSGSLLLPTLVVYGLNASGNTSIAVRFNPTNARDFLSVVAKVLSFASYELPRFIGPNSRQRLAWALGDLRLTPFVATATLLGLLQPFVMIVVWFRRSGGPPGWRRMKWLAASVLLLTFASFLFTLREPWSLAFYLDLPIVFLYSLHCYAFFVRGERWLALAAALMVSGVVTSAALAARSYRERSLYCDRALVERALATRDYRLLGERRPGTYY